MQKNEVLSILKTAQDLGTDYIHKRISSPVCLSPAKKNIAGNSFPSLLEGLSFFRNNAHNNSHTNEREHFVCGSP
jgi:hypothetical protein